MRSVLITGAKGLLGSHLLPRLARQRHVFTLGRAGGAEAPNVTPLEADLARPIDVSALPGQVDEIVYLAQSSRFRDFPDGAADMFQVNLAQPLALLDYARRAGASRFVYASTGSVYAPGPAALLEDDPTPAEGFYASSKLAAERLALSYKGLLGITALRFFFIYGRGQKRDMLLPRLVDSVRGGRPVKLQGGEGIRINPVHADEAAAAVEAALDLTGSHVVNVAGPEPLSIRRICEMAGVALGRAPQFETDPAPGRDLVADIGLMTRLLHSPRIGFEEGVRDLL
jgi:nucleoside-diphosphate-sugar epimerase